MAGYRNVFGDLEYELGDYFVPHRTGGTGKYCILKHEPWRVTDAYIVIDSYNNWWEKTPLFDSWIQAVKFLKENIGDLL